MKSRVLEISSTRVLTRGLGFFESKICSSDCPCKFCSLVIIDLQIWLPFCFQFGLLYVLLQTSSLVSLSALYVVLPSISSCSGCGFASCCTFRFDSWSFFSLFSLLFCFQFDLLFCSAFSFASWSDFNFVSFPAFNFDFRSAFKFISCSTFSFACCSTCNFVSRSAFNEIYLCACWDSVQWVVFTSMCSSYVLMIGQVQAGCHLTALSSLIRPIQALNTRSYHMLYSCCCARVVAVVVVCSYCCRGDVCAVLVPVVCMCSWCRSSWCCGRDGACVCCTHGAVLVLIHIHI